MKKITLSLVLLLISTVFTFAANTWQSLNLTKTAGGTINTDINMMAVDGGKLYVATADGIWVSPSANGGDFEPFGLQGIKVTHLSFKTLKLAIVNIVALDDATKTANKLYKHNGSSWELTNLNPTTTWTFGGPASNFDQIQDGSNNTVILVPTWGNGIWRSTDGGANFSKYAYSTNDHGTVYRTVTGLWAYGDKLYGTDKTTGSAQYLLTSTDFGATWSNVYAGNYFNPRAFHARKVADQDYLYMGGDRDGAQGTALGSIDYTNDPANGWNGSVTVGDDYSFINKIIGDDNGPLYMVCSKTNVMVSNDNADTFIPVGTGIGIIANPPRYFLSDLVKNGSKLYVSTLNTNGIYVIDLNATALTDTKASLLSLYTNAAQTELIVNTEAGSTITMYSVTGKLLTSVNAVDAKTLVKIKNLKASVYIVKVISADGKLSTNRFVKN